MKTFLSNNRFLLGTYLFLILVAAYFMLTYERNVIHLYVNQYVGNRYLNALFFVFDHIGDGFMAPVIIACITAVNVRAGIYSTAAFLLSSAIASILKFYFFDDADRPVFIFENYYHHFLKRVEGVHVNIHNSFPSGHATQGFSILMSTAFCMRRDAFKIVALFVAVLGAFSRVYLSQHWLVDIVAGSLIGTLCSLVLYYVFIYRNLMPRLDKPAATLFSKTQT